MMAELAHGPTAAENDLALLRKLSISNGGFSQPHLLHERLQHLAKTDKELGHPPSKELLNTLDPSTCHRKLLWKKIERPGLEATAEHRDERQVELDVNRSFVYYPKHVPDPVKNHLRETLSQIIVTILRRFPKLNYFQGYHDIVSIFVLNFLDLQSLSIASKGKEKLEDYPTEKGDHTPVDNARMDQDLRLLEEAVQNFTLHRIRDSMTSDLSPIMGYLRFTQAILQQEKPGLASLISQTSSLPLFSLSWILTLTSHDLTSLDVVSRVFDFLLCHPPVMICYVACAICLTKTDEIDKLVGEAAAEGCELDLDMVHFVMASLPPLAMDPPEQTVAKPESDGVDVKGPPKVVPHHLAENPSAIDPPPADQPRSETEQQASSDGDDRQIKQEPDKQQPPRSKAGVPIDEIIRSALRLYTTYSPSDPRLKLDKIMGPKSCIHTWTESLAGRLSDEDAEKILDLPLALIVRPGPGAMKPRARSKPSFSVARLTARLQKCFAKQHRPRLVLLTTSVLVACVAVGYYAGPSSFSSSSAPPPLLVSFLRQYRPARTAFFGHLFRLHERLASLCVY